MTSSDNTGQVFRPSFVWLGEANLTAAARLAWGLAVLAAGVGTWNLVSNGLSAGVVFFYVVALLLMRPAYALLASLHTTKRLLRTYGDRTQAVTVGGRTEDPVGRLLFRLHVALATDTEIVVVPATLFRTGPTTTVPLRGTTIERTSYETLVIRSASKTITIAKAHPDEVSAFADLDDRLSGASV